jgi:hypothetical protein
VFGSLIHKNGAQFDPQVSDVDVICRFPAGEGYLQKWKAVVSAASSVSELNLDLLRCLGRKDASQPIASVVPVSEVELDSGLHKDKASQFYSHNDFVSVVSRVTGPIGKEHTARDAAIEGALDSLREAQRARNKILSVAPTGSIQFQPYDGPDPLPKSFVRCAAQTRWALTDGLPDSHRFDVNEGLVYALQLLVARRQEASEVNDLLERVVVQMGGRGQSTALDSQSQMLLWEILAADAAALILPRTDKRSNRISKKSSATHRSARQSSGQLAQALNREALKRAGFKCAYPGCGVPLGENGIGQIASIRSVVPGAPRYDPSLTRKDAASLDNLIVLCPTHHRVVDADPQGHPAKIMTEWTNRKSGPVAGFSSDNLFTIISLILKLLP